VINGATLWRARAKPNNEVPNQEKSLFIDGTGALLWDWGKV